jgi:hypothetical protein
MKVFLILSKDLPQRAKKLNHDSIVRFTLFTSRRRQTKPTQRQISSHFHIPRHRKTSLQRSSRISQTSRIIPRKKQHTLLPHRTREFASVAYYRKSPTDTTSSEARKILHETVIHTHAHFETATLSNSSGDLETESSTSTLICGSSRVAFERTVRAKLNSIDAKTFSNECLLIF